MQRAFCLGVGAAANHEWKRRKPEGSTKRNRRRERRPSRPVDGNRNAAEITNFPQGQEASDFPKDSVPREFGPDPSNGAWAAISSCGAGEERIADAPHSSPLRCSDCAGFVHDLANVVTGISVTATEAASLQPLEATGGGDGA